MHAFFLAWSAFTLPEVNCRLELALQYTLTDALALRFRGGLGRGVAALSLLQRQRGDINVSSFNWRDGEIRKLLIM